MFQFLRLSTKFLAVLRLSVNPIETLCIGCGEGERQDIFEKATLRYEGTLNVQKIHYSKDFCPELQLSALKREINLPKKRRHDDSISVKSRIFL